jgi:GT2 family glycosyltransferase
LDSLRGIVAAELHLAPERLRLRAGPEAKGRSRGAATVRWIAEVDGEARYSIKLYPEGFRRPVDEIIDAAGALSRDLGVRTPKFVARIRAPGFDGIVEEFLGDAPTLQEMLVLGEVGEDFVAGILTSYFEKFSARRFPAGTVLERDRSRCLAALRWRGEGTALHKHLSRVVKENNGLFSPDAWLVHEDLIPSNVVMVDRREPVLVDFDSCCLTTIPWFAAWRASHASKLPRFFWLAEWDRPGLVNVFDLCGALETELQCETLEPAQFALDREKAFQNGVDRPSGEVPAGQEEAPGNAPGSGPDGGTLPLVSIVVVNHNGRRFIDPLFAALSAQTYPRREIVFVDNASTDGSADYVAFAHSWALLVRSAKNLGFSGGNNLGVARASGSLIAFLNNDTRPEPGWLSALVENMLKSVGVGAVGSKILFLTPYLRVDFSTEAHVPAASGNSEDRRALGAAVDIRMAIGGSQYDKPLFVRGFYGQETWEDRVVRWTEPDATAYLPVSARRPRTLLLMVCGAGHGEARTLRVAVGGVPAATIRLSGEFRTVDVPLGEAVLAATDMINNAGSFLDAEGNAGDRGIFRPDDGSFDAREDVTSLCGCSMLVSRDLFLKLGGFDPYFFMYFEDSDLSWRIRRAGYRLVYEPRSVVRHVHAASSGEGSPLFNFFVTRNGPLMKIKNLPFGRAVAAYRAVLARGALARKACPGGTPKAAVSNLKDLTAAQIERAALSQAARRGLRILAVRLLRAGRPI